MKVLCISASNMENKSLNESTSYKICQSVLKSLSNKNTQTEIIDLRTCTLSPCTGCGKCYTTHRCRYDKEFNDIYNKIINSKAIFIVSPHYAPIPAKLSMLLEKMEQITFLHWGRDYCYKSEAYDLPAGIISHGGGADWALQEYKRMVNDTVANALATIQMKVVPYSSEWNTGISLPVKTVEFVADDIFPKQEYDWVEINKRIAEYVDFVVNAAKQEGD